MSKSRKKGKRAMTVAIYILLITWILLLALLIGIYMLRLQGYETFTEWMNRNESQEVLNPDVLLQPTQVAVATPTPIIVPTNTPTPTVSPTPTLTPTPGPTATPTPTLPPVKTMVFSGDKTVDEKLREQAEELFGLDGEVCYVSYEYGVYFSVIFQKETDIYPVVYNVATGEEVTGSDLIKDTYFAIVKERLQTYLPEQFPEEAEDEFVSYEQVYEAEDYQKIYFTEDKLVFCFDENTLTDNHPVFYYTTELAEAEAFFKTNPDGSVKGPYIRDLDPNAKMIAITFDDGPHPKVEKKLFQVLEKYDARATFFFLGQRMEEWYPDAAAATYAAGHEVASHTYSHEVNFQTDSAEKIWSEVNETNLVIANATGYAPDYVRFPGGSFGKRSIQVPMIKVNWNMDSIDYRDKNKSDGAERIFNRLKNHGKLGDGSIVLLHSIYQNSCDGAELLMNYLADQGYVFVTLSELFYYKGFEPQYDQVYLDGLGTTAKKK